MNTNTKSLSDTELEQLLITQTQNERELTLQIIELLEEVERRKLHLVRGYGSLLEYCVKELKYSESSAYRRISAMRVAREVPEIKARIQEGALHLTAVSQAQTFFKAEQKQKGQLSIENKKQILQQIENKSSRETEKILAKLNPEIQIHKTESVRALPAGRTQITLVIEEELAEKLDKLKAHLSHAVPTGRYIDLLNHLADHMLKRYETLDGKHERNEKTNNRLKRYEILGSGHDRNELQKSRSATPAPVPKPKHAHVHANTESSTKHHQIFMSDLTPRKFTRYIPQAWRRQIWQKYEGRCAYQDQTTGRRCSRQKYLEVDHIHPLARGGSSEPKNLQLLCDAHNRLKGACVGSDV